ncbi:unnamed protein product [Somion occarium]|uniref:Xylanolytic transcriptional activator regulatory domain-containing protein n=1 Tax=Somion occarium TaxID=3059160 RepID=A0ABP1E3D5_9APHY
MPRFLRRLTGRFSTSTISPALVNSMQLLTLQLVDDPQLRSHEPQLLSRVLQALAAATANINPATMIEILQAEVLVSFYFFNRDRKLEGGYHATAAVSLAVACDLHKVRGVQGGGSTSPSSGAHYRLPVPADDVEEGERIQGFWVVYCVDRCWTVALKSQSVLSRGDFASQIETPWPIETSNYEQGQYPQALRHRNLPTVKHFLENAASNGWDRSCLALRAQVSTLFERATDLANQWNPGAPGFQTRFLALDNRIEHFKRSLPGLSLTEASSSQDDRPAQTDTEKLRCMLCCHTLVQCATIQLHTPLQQGQDPTNSRTLAAAIAAANLLREVDVRSLSFVDPIMGVLWSTISQVLIQGIVNLRRMRPRQSSSGRSATPGAHLPGEMVVTSALDCVQMTLEALSGTSPLLERELANLRQARFEMHPNV